MSQYTDVDVVSFDVWRTLIKASPTHRPIRNEILRQQLGLPSSLSDELVQVATAVDDAVNAATDATGIQYGTSERLTRIAEHFGHPVTPMWILETTRQLRTAFSKNPPVLIESDLPATFRAIKASGRGIVVISNTGFTDGNHVQQGLEALGLWQYVDHGFFSDQVGLAKPSQEIFRLASQATGVAAKRLLHIGDNLAADYQGARSAGLKSLWFTTDQNPAYDTISKLSSLTALLPERISL